MTLYTDNRPHPLGLIDNPEWRKTEAVRAELYLEDRARRDDPEREPNRFHIALAVLGCVVIAASLFSAVFHV